MSAEFESLYVACCHQNVGLSALPPLKRRRLVRAIKAKVEYDIYAQGITDEEILRANAREWVHEEYGSIIVLAILIAVIQWVVKYLLDLWFRDDQDDDLGGIHPA
jgi:hypothetical protein